MTNKTRMRVATVATTGAVRTTMNFILTVAVVDVRKSSNSSMKKSITTVATTKASAITHHHLKIRNSKQLLTFAAQQRIFDSSGTKKCPQKTFATLFSKLYHFSGHGRDSSVLLPHESKCRNAAYREMPNKILPINTALWHCCIDNLSNLRTKGKSR